MKLLLVNSLQIIAIQHASMLLMLLRFFFKLMSVSFVSVYEFNLRLTHEVSSLISLLYEFFGSLHFRLLIKQASA